jgi:hypothetical protein
MLGPSVLMFGPPFCTGYAFHACRRGDVKTAARLGLALAIAELLFVVTMVILMVYAAIC